MASLIERKKSKVEKLTGKENYSTWAPATLMELRTNKAAKALNQTSPENPNGMDQQTINDKTKIWLSEQEEEPDTGWTTQKITRNKERWRKAAQVEYDEYLEVNDVALGIIYNNCASQCQNLIKEDTIAREAWNRLKEALSTEEKAVAGTSQGYIF